MMIMTEQWKGLMYKSDSAFKLESRIEQKLRTSDM